MKKISEDREHQLEIMLRELLELSKSQHIYANEDPSIVDENNVWRREETWRKAEQLLDGQSLLGNKPAQNTPKTEATPKAEEKYLYYELPEEFDRWRNR